MEKVQVKFGDWIENGFNLYKANFGVLVVASLIAVLLGTVTFGILAGPMMAGILMITLQLVDKKKPAPTASTVFKGFDYFLNALLFVVVWGAIIMFAAFLLGLVPCLGQLAAICLIYAAQAFLMFGMFLIVDKKMDFWPASMESINIVKGNFWPFLGFAVVTAIIGSIGGIACGIGIIFTIPIQVCSLAIAYREIFDGVVASGHPDDSAPEGEPPDNEPIHPAR